MIKNIGIAAIFGILLVLSHETLSNENHTVDDEFQYFGNPNLCAKITQFPCRDYGRCVQGYYICNGFEDCLNGKDETPYNETIHANRTDGIRCPLDDGGDCFLPTRYKCDGIGHCKNNVDECNCPGTTFFKCREGECVHNTSLCNGIVDCSNGADELNDTSNVHVDSTTNLVDSTFTTINCTTVKNTQCWLPEVYACDGHLHCKNYVDECFCQNNTKFYRCSEDKCIYRHQVCDGRTDCPNGEDEVTEDSLTTGFNASAFPCSTADNRTCALPWDLVCDGVDHCSLYEDECSQCGDSISSGYFQCRDGGCITMEQVCNGVPDCENSEDEEKIEKHHTIGADGMIYSNSTKLGFDCATRQKTHCLLPEKYVCDGYGNCAENRDECGCKGGEFSFQCGGTKGGCLPRKNFCDVKRNCKNGRDELAFSYKTEGFECTKYSTRRGYRMCDLPRYYVCDGVPDCLTKEDEILCQEADHISSGSFKCLDGRKVITKNKLCDDKIDCLDLSDECFLCGNLLPICKRSCGDKDANSTCIPLPSICNGVKEHDIDEAYCSSQHNLNPYMPLYGHTPINDLLCCNGMLTCNKTIKPNCKSLFKCKTGRPGLLNAPKYAHACDGVITCLNGEDECSEKCSHLPNYNTSQFRARCALALERNGPEVCNGKFKGVKDELNCEDIRFYCESDYKDPVNIHRSRLCDKVADCADNSDEGNCSTDTHFYCSKNPVEFLMKYKICDGREDCKNGIDECQNCTSSPFSNDQHLISSVILRVFVWISGMLSLSANLFAMSFTLYDLSFRRKHLNDISIISKIHLFSLSLADFIVGVYLISIAAADRAFAGKYCYKDRAWRSSTTCEVIGVLGLLGSQASVFTLTMLTLHRSYTLITPFRDHRKYTAVLRVLLIWLCAILLSTIPVMERFQDYFLSSVTYNDTSLWPVFNRQQNSDFVNKVANISHGVRQSIRGRKDLYYWKEIFEAMDKLNHTVRLRYGYYSVHGVCLSNLYPDQNVDISWGYTTAIMSVNFLSFVIIGLGCIKIYKDFRKNSKIRAKTGRKDPMSSLQKKISIIILTDFLCWMPICIACFAKLGGSTIPPQMYAVTAIVILPINSAINPIIYSNLPHLLRSKIYAPLMEGFLSPPKSKVQSSSQANRTVETRLNSSITT